MSTQTTRWRPDTCGCIIEYTWDTEQAPESRAHQLKKITPGPEHAGLPTDEARYAAVVGENSNKNLVLGVLNEVLPPDKILESDLSSAWSFDAQRKLVLTLSKLNAIEKAACVTAIAAKGLTAEVK